jgi:predicted aconitase with swiveling domain
MAGEEAGMVIKGYTVCQGKAEGEAVVYGGPFSFLGDLDPNTGKVPIPNHPLEGLSLAGKICIFTTGHGSSGGPTYAWAAKRRGNTPAAMIFLEVEPIIATAVIAAEIPTVDKPDKDPFELIRNGDWVKVDAAAGTIEVVSR